MPTGEIAKNAVCRECDYVFDKEDMIWKHEYGSGWRWCKVCAGELGLINIKVAPIKKRQVTP